ncbi:MAG: hypothetical protein QM757_06005 [Paludibaculum sp.]
MTYTRTLAKNDDTTGFGIQADNQFDMDANYSQSADFQRDTVRANGIVNMPWKMTLAGSFLYGSGQHYNATLSGKPFNKPGTNRLNIGAPITIPASVLDRWEGPAVIATNTVWPRNALRGLPLHKIDLRLSKSLKLGGANITGLAEVFNVFNWKNYGSYNTQLDSATFGQPVANSGTPTFTPGTARRPHRVLSGSGRLAPAADFAVLRRRFRASRLTSDTDASLQSGRALRAGSREWSLPELFVGRSPAGADSADCSRGRRGSSGGRSISPGERRRWPAAVLRSRRRSHR